MSRPSCRTRDRDTPSGSCVAIPAGAVDSDTAQPTGQVVEPQVPVALGTITNDVTLPGTINAPPCR